MSSKVIAAVLLAVLCACEARSFNDRSLLASISSRTEAVSTSAGGEAQASIQAKAKGDGRVDVEAFGSAESFELFKTEVKKIKVTVEKEVADGRPIKAAANVAGKAIGKAVAKTLATVLIVADSTGEDNELCASAEANVKARAEAAARVVLEVFVKAENRDNVAEADGLAEATAIALAEAESSASGQACLKGKGSVAAYQESFANAVSTAYATVVVNALGEIDEDGAKASVVNRANSGVEENVDVGVVSDNQAIGDGEAVSEGSGNANSAKFKNCKDIKRVNICCRKGKPNGTGSKKCKCGLKCSMSYKPLAGTTSIFIYTADNDVEGLAKDDRCQCSF